MITAVSDDGEYNEFGLVIELVTRRPCGDFMDM